MDGVIIDPVWDFDQPSGQLKDHSIQQVVKFISQQKINVRGILETHAHADHLSSAHQLKAYYPEAITAIGSKIKLVQAVFKEHFNIDYVNADASQFDLLLEDFQDYEFGTLKLKAIPTPGHTPACMSYLFGNKVFTGDALFMPDYGTGRCDFPKGSSKALFHSVSHNLYSLPDETEVYVGHDYQPGGRELAFQTTIGESKKKNIQLTEKTTEQDYIHFRDNRDKTLSTPLLLLPSLQVNINGGQLPPAENNGVSYLKTPLQVLKDDSFQR